MAGAGSSRDRGFLDRTLGNLRRAWQDAAGAAWGAAPAPPRPDLPEDDAKRLQAQMLECLEAKGGEVSARGRAAALGRAYLSLDPEGRRRFLELMATGFDVDRARLETAARTLLADDDEADRTAAEEELRRALEPPRLRLLTQFNGLPEGVKFLVDMRAELLQLADESPALAGLERDLGRLLRSWFDVGFLELRRITWESPAALLERLIAYEAVHAIGSWDDLKNRMESDRRLFAFFHPRMPEEPLIFVEVALVDGMAGNIHELLDTAAPVADPGRADTAIFYSISNAQPGLAGISFGGFLIKRVVDLLSAEFRRLKIFATLSPIPGFGAWLEAEAGAAGGLDALLTAGERKAIEGLPGETGFATAIRRLILDKRWHENKPLARALKEPLMRLGASYLLRAKRADGQRARDPVAHFHLSNGARIERLNWLADTSPRGRLQSAGMMVNYLYRPDDIEKNHEAYRGAGKIAATAALRGLAKG